MLRKQLEVGRAIETAGTQERPYQEWVTTTTHWLEKAFGKNSDKVERFETSGESGAYFSGMDFDQAHRDRLSSKLSQVSAFVTLLEQEVALEDEAPAVDGTPPQDNSFDRSKVFIVHGHDDGAKQAAARFVEKLGLTAIILHEQTNEGRTIIEKFEAHGAVGFAVVLLTPDDRGGTATASFEEQKLRARQNVVFELGYFVGRIGRKNVCALYKSGTELPSDIQGVLFVAMDDANRWHVDLAKEMKAAGLAVDMNKAF